MSPSRKSHVLILSPGTERETPRAEEELKVLSKFEKPSTDYIVRFLFAKKSINEH